MTAVFRYSPWILFALAAAAALWFRASAASAAGARDAAIAERRTLQLALDVERGSTKAATDAVARLVADAADSDRRTGAVVADLRAQAEKYRAILRGCQSDDAVARRAGQMFP